MARFRALASDDSSDEENSSPINDQSNAQHYARDSEDSDQDSSSTSSSEMLEDELLSSQPRPGHKPQPTGRNALVEESDGEIHYAHEVRVQVSPPSSVGSSPPARNRAGMHGDPTIIPWAQHIGVDAQKMHVMQTSLFRVPEEAAVLRAMNQQHTKQPRPPIASTLRAPLNPLNRKHSRDSDGDGLRFESQERASFAYDINPPLYRPSRKYSRVDSSSSITNENEGAFIDAGLALGRSFRVGWGPRGMLVHLGSICGPMSKLVETANSSVVKISRNLFPLPPPIALLPTSSPSATPLTLMEQLLQLQLTHTPISKDDAGIPFAYPSACGPSSSTSASANPELDSPHSSLHFNAFASLFPPTDLSNPASIFRLGSVLFDPINLHLSTKRRGVADVSAITPDIKNRVLTLRRKTALGIWLEEVVKPAVELDLRMKSNGHPTGSGSYTNADAAFTHLTGHQIEQACNVAGDAGYFKLSTLISQAGGDHIFKSDIISQLSIWKEDKLGHGVTAGGHELIGRGVWRVHALLAGLLDSEDEALDGEDICSGLDWKRVLGLCLWYQEGVDASIADVVRAYEELLLHNSGQRNLSRPIPAWLLEKQSRGEYSTVVPSSILGSSYLALHSANTRGRGPEDVLYALIRLHADPTVSLSHALDPLSFAPSGMDWGIGMCWHLYIIISRVMRVRDFADRGEVEASRRKVNGTMNGIGSDDSDIDTVTGKDLHLDEEDIEVEGHSPCADLLTSSYALELESWGLIQEAAFVLLHLEGSYGRQKALKDLLIRSAPLIDDWLIRGVVGSLKIPMAWIHESKALYALDQGNIYAAYECYLDAGLYSSAHELAVLELAPDAILRKDLVLLKELFERFDHPGTRDKVDCWSIRGKVFLDYVHAMTVLPTLQEQLDAENRDHPTVPDATVISQINDITRRIPRLIGVLPDVLYRSRLNDMRHAAALEEMVKGLLVIVGKVKPELLSQIQQQTLTMLDGATKLDLVRGIGLARFLSSTEA